jgi:hypothetical protein
MCHSKRDNTLCRYRKASATACCTNRLKIDSYCEREFQEGNKCYLKCKYVQGEVADLGG